MKKVIILILAIVMSLMFSGCSDRLTPSVASSVAQLYDTTKTIVVKGQEIVVINSDLLDEDTLERLDNINEAVKLIDASVSILTNSELEEYEKLSKELDEIQKYFDNNKANNWSREMIIRSELISDVLQMYDVAVINRSRKTLEVINR